MDSERDSWMQPRVIAIRAAIWTTSSQPPLTLGDALISVSYGVTIYGENIRTGGWLLVVQMAALIAITFGCIQLSRSLAMVHGPQQPAPSPAASGG